MTCVQDCQREAELEKRIAELEAALVSVVEGWRCAKRDGDLIYLGVLWENYQRARKALRS